MPRLINILTYKHFDSLLHNNVSINYYSLLDRRSSYVVSDIPMFSILLLFTTYQTFLLIPIIITLIFFYYQKTHLSFPSISVMKYELHLQVGTTKHIFPSLTNLWKFSLNVAMYQLQLQLIGKRFSLLVDVPFKCAL